MIKGLLTEVRTKKPLIHHITNMVTVSECANATLCIGALPVMAHAPEEVEQMVTAAGALVLNIGTLTQDQVKSMIIAGRKANEKGIPVILDPVGAGATDLRTDSANEILRQVRVSVIKGNRAEISILAGMGGQIKGVEAVGDYSDILNTCKALANKYGTTVAMTSKQDIVTDGETVYLIDNGHPFMGKVVGTGCMAASVIGAYAAVEGDTAKAAAAALATYGIAGEMAASRGCSGPGTFKALFFDELHNLSEEVISERQKINPVRSE